MRAGALRAALCPAGSPDASLFAAPPEFLETPPQVLEVQELAPLTLRCVARGSPQPHVTWKLRGQDLGQGQGPMQVGPGAGQWGPVGVGAPRWGPGSRGPAGGRAPTGLPPGFRSLRGCRPLLAAHGRAGSEPCGRGRRPRGPPSSRTGPGPQVRNGTLWIRRVQRSSSGIYTCQASSTEGSATHHTQLLVLGAGGSGRGREGSWNRDACAWGWPVAGGARAGRGRTRLLRPGLWGTRSSPCRRGLLLKTSVLNSERTRRQSGHGVSRAVEEGRAWVLVPDHEPRDPLDPPFPSPVKRVLSAARQDGDKHSVRFSTLTFLAQTCP